VNFCQLIEKKAMSLPKTVNKKQVVKAKLVKKKERIIKIKRRKTVTNKSPPHTEKSSLVVQAYKVKAIVAPQVIAAALKTIFLS